MKNTQCKFKKTLILTTLLVFLCTPVLAQDILKNDDLTSLSLEDLMNVNVTSVSKKPQRLIDAASAIYVITQEDIRRSGARTIPDLLRMVPGIQVARMDANKWAITSRGFNGRFANKLLVMIDGRSVYTPAFSGVIWEVKDTLFEDIDRIEVIRGPGGTLWGANAVNGVINVITKKAGDTQGGLVNTGIGTEEQGFGGVRYGGKVGEDVNYRVYLKYFNRDNTESAGSIEGHDDWRMGRGGFRVDWDKGRNDTLTFQGDYYDGTAGQRVTVPDLSISSLFKRIDEDIDLSGGNFLFRWNRILNEESDLSLQFYYDRTERKEFVIEEIRDTFDIDFQHRFPMPLNNEVLWGIRFRFTTDDVNGSSILSVPETSREDPLFSAFVQDEITLIPDKLYFTLGSKIEHNNYTGIEVQPSARILFKPSTKHTVWGSVSRAVRTPSRLEHTIHLNQVPFAPGSLFPGSPATLGIITGDNNFDAEVLTAFEIGYRTQPTNRLSFDATAFYNVYYDLQTLENGTPAPPDFSIPFFVRNKMNGDAYGVELAARWQALDWWNIKGSYSYMKLNLHIEGDSSDTISEDGFEDDIPNHQFSIRSMMNLPGDLELDSWIRYVDSVPSVDVDSYITLDARLGWNLTEKIELSIVGRNLLEKRHKEYGPSSIINTQVTDIERSVYASITLQY